MNILDYKNKLNVSFKKIEKQTGITSSMLQRASIDSSKLTLAAAKKLVEWSKGAITYEDLAANF